MTSAPYCVAEDELQAYADGILPANRRAIVESYLGATPAEQKRVESYRRLNVELHRFYDRPDFSSTPLSYEFLASELFRAVRRQRRMRLVARGAVALFIAIGAAGTAWSALDLYDQHPATISAATQPATGTQLVTLSGNPGKAAAAKLLAAARQKPKAAQPLTQLAGLQQQAPDLVRLGFTLSSGKVVTTSDGPAVELSYHGKGNHRMTLAVRPADSVHKTAFTILEDTDASLVSWQIGGFTYSLVGNVGRQRLLELARAVSDSLQLPTAEGGPGWTVPATAAPATPLIPPPGSASNALKEAATSSATATTTADRGAETGSHPSDGTASSSIPAPGAAVQKVGLKPPG
jgi:anti-sigma factor RsiW